MMTQKVQDCIAKAIEEPQVTKLLKQREKHPNFWLDSIRARIVRKGVVNNQNKMIVRVGFDFSQKFADELVKEDILVDVEYSGDRQTGVDKFRILNVVIVPEI